MNIWKCTKVYTTFLFYGPEGIEDRVKLLQSNVLNCCLQITMANLCKIGLKNEGMTFQRT